MFRYGIFLLQTRTAIDMRGRQVLKLDFKSDISYRAHNGLRLQRLELLKHDLCATTVESYGRFPLIDATVTGHELHSFHCIRPVQRQNLPSTTLQYTESEKLVCGTCDPGFCFTPSLTHQNLITPVECNICPRCRRLSISFQW